MTLVLQCAVCGTYHPVGTTVCSTCRATGLQNLRLLFECTKCFRLGLTPTCEQCDPRPLPYEVVEDAEQADEFVPAWDVTDEEAESLPEADEFEITLDEDEVPPDEGDSDHSIDVG